MSQEKQYTDLQTLPILVCPQCGDGDMWVLRGLNLDGQQLALSCANCGTALPLPAGMVFPGPVMHRQIQLPIPPTATKEVPDGFRKLED